jgi:hypothetical protein
MDDLLEEISEQLDCRAHMFHRFFCRKIPEMFIGTRFRDVDAS